jgi:hypothetical protein
MFECKGRIHDKTMFTKGLTMPGFLSTIEQKCLHLIVMEPIEIGFTNQRDSPCSPYIFHSGVEKDSYIVLQLHKYFMIGGEMVAYL